MASVTFFAAKLWCLCCQICGCFNFFYALLFIVSFHFWIFRTLSLCCFKLMLLMYSFIYFFVDGSLLSPFGAIYLSGVFCHYFLCCLYNVLLFLLLFLVSLSIFSPSGTFSMTSYFSITIIFFFRYLSTSFFRCFCFKMFSGFSDASLMCFCYWCCLFSFQWKTFYS